MNSNWVNFDDIHRHLGSADFVFQHLRDTHKGTSAGVPFEGYHLHTSQRWFAANSRNMADVKGNGGFCFGDFLHYRHYNGLDVLTTSTGLVITNPESFYDNDAHAALNGVSVGSFYLLSSENFYGSPQGVAKKRIL